MSLKPSLDKFFSVLFPSRCISCSSIVNSGQQICSTCWKGVDFISEPSCSKCDYPFEFDIGSDFLCGGCIEKSRYFDRAMSVVRYGDATKRVVHKLKYSDKLHLAKNIARLMYSKILKSNIKVDVIVPVPMHKKKMMRRFYNQSALIAQHLSNMMNVKSLPNCLIKTRHHEPQTGLRRELRESNVRKSFDVHKIDLEEIHNRHVLLVDDVYTTGSTVDECSKILKQSYCREITVITFARVV